MDQVKSGKPADNSRDPSTEEIPQSDLQAVEKLSGQQSPQRAKLDRRVRDELIALCQAQEEQRRRIDAANQRRVDRSQVDSEKPSTDEGVNSTSTSDEVPVSAVAVESNQILNRLSSESLERAQGLYEIGKSGSEDAFHTITDAFDDSMIEVRNAAARALYDWRSYRAASFARALREARPDRRQRIGSSIATSGLAAEAVANLNAASREDTYDAFSLLFLMAKTGQIESLFEIIETHQNIQTRLMIIKLLALSGNNQVLRRFAQLAENASLPAEVRAALTEAT